MYELNPVWEAYYRELDPKKRKKLMQTALEEADDGANAFRQKLYEKRHVDPKDPGRVKDLFLLQCAYLPSLYRKRKFFLINMKKEIRRTIEDLCLDQVEQYTETEKNALFWEMKNAARRYFKTCTGGRYGATLFGISKAKDDEKMNLAGRDAFQMSRGIARYAKAEKELQIFCDAVQAAFEESYEEGAELYQRMVEKYKKDE